MRVAQLDNIFLTGFMGVGKTTVAKALSSQCEMDFLDLDQEIVRLESVLDSGSTSELTAGQIFLNKGETYFRELECEVVRRVVHLENTVIALGGGAFCHPLSRELILERGLTVYLQGSIDTLILRLKQERSFRPLLVSDGAKSDEALRVKIENLLRFRVDLYEQAHFKVNTDHKTVNEVVSEVIHAAQSIDCKIGRKIASLLTCMDRA